MLPQNQINGLSLLGIGMTAAGLIQTSSGMGKGSLVVAAIMLCLLGLGELFFSSKK